MGDTIIREVTLLLSQRFCATMGETGRQGRLDVFSVCFAPTERAYRFTTPLVRSPDMAYFLSAVDRPLSN